MEGPPRAPQPNGEKLATFDARFASACIQSRGQLWNVHSINFRRRSLVRLYKFSTAPANTSTQFLLTLQTTAGLDYLFNPSVTTASGIIDAPLFLTASRTIPSDANNGNAAHIVFSGPNSHFDGWQFNVLATSPEQFTKCEEQEPELKACRWGDYSATTIDPLMSGRAWSINQIATGSNESNWKTGTGAVDIILPASPVAAK